MPKKYFDVHAPVFWPAALLIVVFITLTLLFRQDAETFFDGLQNGIADSSGWFFVLAVNVFLVFALILTASPVGQLRIGGPDARPEFGTFAWFSMLFSAGMGIGIMFFSVAEPINHLKNPPTDVAPLSPEAAETAMGFTYLHWGLHVWAIYAIVGLSLAYFAFSRKLPLSIRSVFFSVLGKRIYGPIGNAIDILAVLATLFGLATSLGLGVQQVSAGLNHLFGLPDITTTHVLLITGITGIATLSVVMGIDKGVKFLSELNLRIAAVFLLALFILGPTLFIFDSFTQNLGYYFQHIFQLGFFTEAYQGSDAGWQNSWTVFYWAWWISWSPFVGMFIARISRGRTVREFMLGVLLVPSLITFLWLSAFGGSATHLVLFEGVDELVPAIINNVSTALYVMLEQFPFGIAMAVIGVVLVTNFFVTSSDSGSLVIDSITAGGKYDAPVGQRIFWAVSEGLVAAVLLIGGGLEALQTAAITTGLPFTLVLILMCYSLWHGLWREYRLGLGEILQQDRHLISTAVHGDEVVAAADESKAVPMVDDNAEDANRQD